MDPSVAALIDKAIRTSDLGLNPSTDGKVVRVPMPAPTEERRKELVKQMHKMLENHRTAVRNIRRDIKEAIDKLEKDKKISQDEQKRALDELEKISHSETKKIRRSRGLEGKRSHGVPLGSAPGFNSGILPAATEGLIARIVLIRVRALRPHS